jgi:hypothetical protein
MGMKKKDFRKNWESVFASYNDAELYAISSWVQYMQAKNHWNQYVGKVWDAYTAQYDKQTEQLAEATQEDGQSVH